MARTRRTRAELSESWDDVASHSPSEDEDRETREEEWARLQEDVMLRTGREQPPREARKRSTRSSVEPELVMPASPNSSGVNGHGKPKARDQTPRFRLNERSMTSGPPAKVTGRLVERERERERERDERTATPRMRLNARSMTSDAGRFGRGPDQGDEVGDGEDDTLSGYAYLVWRRILAPTLAFIIDIVGMAVNKTKPIIAYALLAYIIAATLIFASNFVTNSVYNALTPICRIPGVITLFDPFFCPLSTKSSTSGYVEGPAEFDKLVSAQAAFDEVLDSASTGANLPMDMKRSEAGIRDLRHVVQYSTLPSRNELVFEFDGFISTARDASRDLSKFNSHIGRAVDHILSTNRWTLSVISDISATEAGRGSVGQFLGTYLNIFAPFQPVSLSRDLLLDQYIKHTENVELQILTLITEAQALLGILDNLDNRLDVIAGIATRDGLKADSDRDALFAYLWTKLGGNRSSVKKLEGQLQLLNDVGTYRRVAWAHVSTTIVKLQAIRDDLENLRERVAIPRVVGTEATPLEVHIDAINLGIQRLEERRDESRKVESEGYRRVLDRAEAGDAKMIG